MLVSRDKGLLVGPTGICWFAPALLMGLMEFVDMGKPGSMDVGCQRGAGFLYGMGLTRKT